MSQYHCFLEPNAVAINTARLDHLAHLDLDIDGREVLEVGAGIGLHTPFFLERACTVMITDGAPENMVEIRRRHPGTKSRLLDLEQEHPLDDLGQFDIVYCYGLLYHMSNPDSVLQRLASVCREKILLELICHPGVENTVAYVSDPSGLNQSVVGRGCRPSRSWILERLNRYFGYGYISATQPDHEDFPTNWDQPTRMNTRAIFVGSKQPIQNDFLLTAPVQQQPRYQKGQ